jgi:hypothetical protein
MKEEAMAIELIEVVRAAGDLRNVALNTVYITEVSPTWNGTYEFANNTDIVCARERYQVQGAYCDILALIRGNTRPADATRTALVEALNLADKCRSAFSAQGMWPELHEQAQRVIAVAKAAGMEL